MTASPIWQRLESLRPALPRHIQFQRRDYNQETWYVLQDKSNGRFHRLNASAYRLLGFMDGRRSLQHILDAASAPEFYESPADVPTREELIHLLQYLHVTDLLVCDMPPSTQELFTRQQQKHRQRWQRLLVNPLTWKIPLGNPDALLTKLLPVARILASRWMGIIWLLVVGYAVLQAGNHWSELTHGQLDNILSPGNLLLLWLTYPLLKVIHELGHGLFTKVWGGDVHECGVVVVLGTPLPYVDATAATAFTAKAQRLMVSAAGMAVELFCAALALVIWLQIDDGLVRDICYNIMIIGSISTLFFNGNPLMRFDGYYLLTDALDLPNLASRANQHVSYLVNRYAYGIKGLFSPAASRQEAILFTVYSLAAFAYRLFILAVIILLAVHHFPRLGWVLAIWLITFQLLWPLVKYSLFLAKGKPLAQTRKRALTLAGGSAGVLLLLLVAVPLPMSTAAEGVLWLPDDARVKAQSSGEVSELLVADGALVEKDQPLVNLYNPQLQAQLAIKQAALREYDARYQQAWMDDRAQAQILAQDLNAIKAEIEHLQERVKQLLVRSSAAGIFRLTQSHQLVGSYLQQGDSIGLIEKAEPLRIRAALMQEEIGLVRQATRRVEVRLAGIPAVTFPALVSQQVPAATFELPSVILGVQGGGRLAVDAQSVAGTKTAAMVFLVDVSVADLQSAGRYGERAYVRFIHPAEPAAVQFYRLLQQLFIRSFGH